MLRNSVKNGNILADGAAQLELLTFSFVDMAEEMPLGLGLQNKVENLQRAKIIVQNAVWRPVCNQNVNIFGYVLIGNPGIFGDGADDNAVAVLHGILKNYNAGLLELLGDGFISASAER